MQVQSSQQTLFNFFILWKSRFPQKSFITLTTGIIFCKTIYSFLITGYKKYQTKFDILLTNVCIKRCPSCSDPSSSGGSVVTANEIDCKINEAGPM